MLSLKDKKIELEQCHCVLLYTFYFVFMCLCEGSKQIPEVLDPAPSQLFEGLIAIT